jgi:ankyrin repeat protein
MNQHSATTPYLRRIWQLAAKGDRAALGERIDQEPTLVQRRGEGGRTLLWEAAKSDRRDIVRWLLDLGADPNAPGVGKPTYGKTSPPETLVMVTPHCVAALRKKRAVAEDLLAAGAVVDIFTASMLGDMTTVDGALAADPSLANAEDPAEDFYPVTPLHHAVAGKQTEVVAALLACGAEAERDSVQLLTIAARRNALGLAGTLLARGATARDCKSLLYSVVDSGAGDWAELLLAHGADASGMGVRGRTLVEFPEVAETMLARGARPTGLVATCNGNNGNRGLHPEYARALLQRGADPDESDGAGRTALTTAAKSGFPEYVDILLEHGADPNAPDGRGRTALARALTAKQWDIAARLIQAGATVPDAPLNKTGETPLHKAAAAGHMGLTLALLDAGADTAPTATNGRTPTDYARRAGHDEIVDALHPAGQ